MNRLVIFWNYFWWNYHINHARKHDDRIEKVIPDWRNKFASQAMSDDQ